MAESISTIERLLDGKTTLKTQKLGHGNIICIGSEVLKSAHEQTVKENEEAVNKAVEEAQKAADDRLKKEMDLLQEILTDEKEQEIKNILRDCKKNIADVQRQCEVAEKKRAREAYDRHQSEKQAAILETLERAKVEKENAILETTKQLTERLCAEFTQRMQTEVTKAIEVTKAEAKIERDAAVQRSKQECEEKFQDTLARLKWDYDKELHFLNNRVQGLEAELNIERKDKSATQATLNDVIEDYKRFQDHTKGFHSDFLLP